MAKKKTSETRKPRKVNSLNGYQPKKEGNDTNAALSSVKEKMRVSLVASSGSESNMELQ